MSGEQVKQGTAAAGCADPEQLFYFQFPAFKKQKQLWPILQPMLVLLCTQQNSLLHEQIHSSAARPAAQLLVPPFPIYTLESPT